LPRRAILSACSSIAQPSWGSKPKHAEFLEAFKFNILCISAAGALIF
jgi:hypothetical protein